MSDRTAIEWSDATWNPITGCSCATPGCTNCYAMKLAGTRLKDHPSRKGLTLETKAGPVWTGEVRFNEGWLPQPLNWRRPRRIFVCAHGDLFHEGVPDEWIDRVFAVMAVAEMCGLGHVFQVLTKRSERMRDWVAGAAERIRARVDWATMPWPLPNVWKGVSVEDQIRANERIPELLDTPAAIRWISAEPLLGPIDLSAVRWQVAGYGMTGALPDPAEHDDFRFWHHETQGLRWVVVGGENGPRPMHPAWARSLRDQCATARVPFLFKQWGSWAPCEVIADESGEQVRFEPPLSLRDAHRWRRWHGDEARSAADDELVGSFFAPGFLAVPTGKKAAGRLLDGRTHDEFPQPAGARP